MLCEILVIAGFVCVLSAIVGGGLTAMGFRIPVIDSLPRQVILGAFGISAIIGGVVLRDHDQSLPVESIAADHRRFRSAWDHRFPVEYVGQVWLRVTPTRARAGSSHRVRITWGSNVRPVLLRRLGPAPRSLIFQKGADDVPVHVSVKPPANISFGTKRPPDRNPLDINRGWTRR